MGRWAERVATYNIEFLLFPSSMEQPATPLESSVVRQRAKDTQRIFSANGVNQQ